MRRREFLASGVGAMATAGLTMPARGRQNGGRRFKLAYAPHFGMFRHHGGEDLVGQLEFMADEGFRALEDNWMARRPPAEQERIAGALDRLGMTMGVFVAHADFGAVTFASPDPAMRDRLVDEMRNAVETARRVNATWCTVVPGRYEPGRPWEYQTAHVVENLKRCSAVCEPAGLTMVLEPLNALRDHPGLFLTKIPQAFQICRAVGSPSCKILDDLYHQQITEGNLIPNIDQAWSEIAYFQVGDNPGRREPTTGEINYRNVFRHIHGKGFTGVVGMEHGNAQPGRAGERAVIDAYVACDAF
ncbi:MAG: TIM barrel protein [Phycisphaerales bacterium]|nr:TIM barrel protein [Phycisphaerae bacterium]NNF42364.1 TIM barrel protein [Phycisphaerales bacterium]NNM25631.1 TIM barrel protein [Phycisphaerales bacterium]